MAVFLVLQKPGAPSPSDNAAPAQNFHSIMNNPPGKNCLAINA
jgi:hypothetical protein